MNAKSRQEMGLVRARVVAVERQGKVDAFTICSGESPLGLPAVGCGGEIAQRGCGLLP